jgi:ubiquinone/menaquinone biosynthesis C-methylase UbiE
MQHHLWFMTLYDQLFLAPIKPNPHNVLDIGTGTGIWAIDFGQRLSPKFLASAEDMQHLGFLLRKSLEMI